MNRSQSQPVSSSMMHSDEVRAIYQLILDTSSVQARCIEIGSDRRMHIIESLVKPNPKTVVRFTAAMGVGETIVY